MSLVKFAVVFLVMASVFSIALAWRPGSPEATGRACPACQIKGDSSLQLTEGSSGDAKRCAPCASAASPGPASAHASGDTDPGANPAPATTDLSPTGHEGIVQASDKDFDRVFRQALGMVLVDFYADWCGPCKVQGQILAQLGQSRQDITIIKVNVDSSPVLARQLDIGSIPTLLAFRDRQVLGAHVGVASAETIMKMFQEARAAAPSGEE